MLPPLTPPSVGSTAGRSLLCLEDVGVMSAAILDIEEDMGLSAFQAEVLVGSLNVIAAFGGLIAGACIHPC